MKHKPAKSRMPKSQSTTTTNPPSTFKQQPIELYYKKNKNGNLFKSLEDFEYQHTQNYIPIYTNFFDLNTTNWNSMNLNHKHSISSIHSVDKDNHNIYHIYNENNKLVTSFFKLAPLLDPVKYMCGKYQHLTEEELFSLPSFQQSTHPKKDDPNNASYVDSFFYYLSSKLLHEYGFIHGIDFYGSFLSVKQNYRLNVIDDLEYLHDSDYFVKHCGELFSIDDSYQQELLNFDTRKNKLRLQFQSLKDQEETKDDFLSVSSIQDLEVLNSVFETTEKVEETRNENTNDYLIFTMDEEKTTERKTNSVSHTTTEKSHTTVDDEDDDSSISSSSSCSSRSSNTSSSTKSSISISSDVLLDDVEELDGIDDTTLERKSYIEENNNDDDNSQTNEDSDDEYSSLDESDIVEATIKTFPVQIIAMENVETTLDYYMENYDISEDEWKAIFMQIIMILITYQKTFDFTHNDLHTNNIMFNMTEEQFIYYQVNGKIYRVPTYNKIFKIIDFGRAIYTFQGKTLCSDSYAVSGDAHSQYNFGVYMDKTKKLIEPNKAFDLCRLACSLYDHFFDEDDDVSSIQPNSVASLVLDWVKDDSGRNILYKSNGKERYPGFKLYKMIARDVHKHLPEEELKKPIFNRFHSNRKAIKKNSIFLNIDKMPSCV